MAENVQEDMEFPYTFCFGSSGWLFVYYFGVIKRIQELGFSKKAQGIGCSGGALACAASLCCEVDCDQIKDYILDCAEDARKSWRNLFKLRTYIKGAIDRFCDEDSVSKVSGRMETSVTVLPFMKNIRLSHFDSLDHLTQGLLASSCIFPLAGMPVWVENVGFCLDGAVSDLQVLQGLSIGGTFSKIHQKGSPKDLTVTVCPFYCSRADIKPSIYLPPWWVFRPPSRSELDGVFHLGYKDMVEWEQAMLRKPESPMGIPGQSWAEALMSRSSQLMRESSEFVNRNCPNMPEMGEMLPHLPDMGEMLPSLPDLSEISDHMPKLPQMPSFPDFPFIEHLPSVDSAQLPRCLSTMFKTDVSNPLWLLMVFIQHVLICITSTLIYTELFWHTVVWGSLTTLTVMLPTLRGVGLPSPRESYVNFRAYLRSAASPRLALHSTPFVGNFVPLRKEKLADHSLIFRVTSFVLEKHDSKQDMSQM